MTRRLRRLLGGATPGVEILTRSHVYLLKAVEQLLARRSRASQAGSSCISPACSPSVDRELAAAPPVVHLHGYLSPRRVDRADAHRPTCCSCRCRSSRRAAARRTVPGKTYEYLASGRPILAAVPDGDARDILHQLRGERRYARPNDVDAMIEAHRSRSLRGSRPSRRPRTTPPIVRRFEYRHLASSSFASVFRGGQNAASGGSASSGCGRANDADADDGMDDAARSKVALHALRITSRPIGGAGAQRSLKFVRYLPEARYDSIVVTGPGAPPGGDGRRPTRH